MEKSRTIYIVAYKGKSLISKLIKWKNNGEYSHTEFYNNFEKNGFETFGALFKGVMFASINWHKKNTPYDIFGVDVTEQQFVKFRDFLTFQNKKKYDKLGIIGYVDSRVKQDDSKWYCSELCYKALQHIGIELFNTNVKFPSPSLIVMSPLLRLIRNGVVGEELDKEKVKAEKDMDEILKKVKESSIQGDKLNSIVENGN